MKLAIIYNTSGISGLESYEFYQPAIDSLLAQDLDDCRVIVSDCLGSTRNRNALLDRYGNNISYCFIDEKRPLPITFNKTVLESIKRLGNFEGFLYIDSGIILHKTDDVRKLYQLFKSGPYGMVSSRTNHDSGYYQWFGLGNSPIDESQSWRLFKDGDFVVPLGKAVNLHCQIFSNSLVETYNKPYTDIFLKHCSESVFSFKCAAVNQKWVVSKDVIAEHRYLHGNASAIASDSTRPNYDDPYLIDSVIDVIVKGKPYGLGYEECAGRQIHDPEKFDTDGFALDPQLAPYIRDNLFLSSNLLDYSSIDCSWI